MRNQDVLRKCLKFFIDTGEKVADMIHSGKINWGKLAIFIFSKGGKIVYLVKHANEAIQYLYDLDSVERESLKRWIGEEFDIADDATEDKIEKVIEKIIDLVTRQNLQKLKEFFSMLKQIKKSN